MRDGETRRGEERGEEGRGGEDKRGDNGSTGVENDRGMEGGERWREG